MTVRDLYRILALSPKSILPKGLKVCSKCGDRSERLEFHKDGRIDMMIYCKCKKVKDTMNIKDENKFFRINEFVDAWNRLNDLFNIDGDNYVVLWNRRYCKSNSRIFR